MRWRERDYWKSLSELADTEEFRIHLHREFPENADQLPTTNGNGNGNSGDDTPAGWSRRNFLTLMGASMALAGLASCRRPVETIVPHVERPLAYDPGTPEFYATSVDFEGEGIGLVVQSTDGRPTKIDGNEQHPASLGGSNHLLQSSILHLYAPERLRKHMRGDAEATAEEFVATWNGLRETFADNRGTGLAVIAPPYSSPTFARLKRAFARRFPRARWATWTPLSNETISTGGELATGRKLMPKYELAGARVIVGIDADFTNDEPNALATARGFADSRRPLEPTDGMSRHYQIESTYTVTGSAADHRLRLAPSLMPTFIGALARELRQLGLDLQGIDNLPAAGADVDAAFVKTVATDLMSQTGRSAIIVGRRQPAPIHALALAINTALGNVGNTVFYYEPTDAEPVSLASLNETVSAMKSGDISTCVILGGNPVYNAPADIDLAGGLERVANTIYFTMFVDETATASDWLIAASHYLEQWGDTRSVDGTIAPTQPLIAPLYDSVANIELIHLMTTGEIVPSVDLVKETWADVLPRRDFDRNWKTALHDGVLAGSVGAATTPRVDARSVGNAFATLLSQSSGNGLEVVFSSGPVHDGSFANVAWCQELPHPITKQAWDNVATLSWKTSRDLGIENGDVVSISLNGATIEIPAWISPGQADNTIGLTLGYGRTGEPYNEGRRSSNLFGFEPPRQNVGTDVGVNVYPLRTANALGVATGGAQLTKTGARVTLAQTQDHWSMEGRPLYREATYRAFQAHESHGKDGKEDLHHQLLTPEKPHHPPLLPLWQQHKFDTGYQWGMTIDLNACTGCGACTVACQSENNIPVVGKEQVIQGREMHWLRLDRYYGGDLDNPDMNVMPMMCQHCEYAPCEAVCPVAATVHDSEGLNTMIYNRCIGTRYCSNNCPYKVRRFNFFNYTNDIPKEHRLQFNQDVTIRFRGVMEKCTYCTQRINKAKFKAKQEDRTVRDGEIVTACQQVCPTKAIVFGDLNDPESEVSKLTKATRSYRMLEEYNLKPRTSYLGRIRNYHPDLAPKATAHGHDHDTKESA